MDLLSGLLDGPRAAEPFLLRVVMAPPWAMHIQDNAPLSLMAVTSGAAWIVPDGGEPAELAAGDVALVRGTSHYLVADSPSTPPQVIIHPGQVCTTPGGFDLADQMGLGLRTWGNIGTAGRAPSAPASDVPQSEACQMLVGVYERQPEVGARFISALPQLAVVKAAEHQSALVELLSRELTTDGPGQQIIINRLLDLLVITMARIVFERSEEATPGWYAAHDDPVVGPALAAIHEDPAHPWTVEKLAATGGTSRAAFAHRFKELVGESPIAFLTEWRVSIAADLLRSGDASVGAVATEVGYSTPYAFSSAFKRIKGVSPSRYRA